MTTLWPQWTTELTKNFVPGEDQLGIQGAAQSYQQYLVPGVITTTDRARYYSFYTWVLYRFINLPNSSRLLSDFRGPFFRKHELALILSAYSHHKDTEIIGGLVGSGTNNYKARSYWEIGDPVSLNLDYFQHKLGGFGQYYRTGMQVMGIIAESEHPKWVYRITPRGESIAQAFERSIADTNYFKLLSESEELDLVSHADAMEYGQRACLCYESLQTGEDLELLREAFFRFDQREPGNPHERRRLTLGVTLDLVHSGQGKISKDDFRPGLYLGEFSPGLFYKPSPELANWASRWQMVQIRQLYTFGLECLWGAFLRHISSLQKGITIGDYLNWLKEQLPEGLRELSVQDYINITCLSAGTDGNWEEDYQVFDFACRMDNERNEYNLYSEAVVTRWDNKILINNGLQILTQLFLRFYTRFENEENIWMELGSRERLPLNKFFSYYREEIFDSNSCVIDLLEGIYKEFILGQHEFIALEKMRYQGYDTFKFYYRDGHFYWPFLTPDEYQEPIRLATIRLFNTLSILSDLGLIESDEEGNLSLTTDGINYHRWVLEA